MIHLPFDVNSKPVREKLLKNGIMDALYQINGKTGALWGKMKAQHMVEHLIWAFKVSSGKIKIDRVIPGDEQLRLKRFLNNNRPTPVEFHNPVLDQEPAPYHYKNLKDAVKQLEAEIDDFYLFFKKNPGVKVNHPVFGMLNGEEWERAHYKHSYHHLLQFNLIEQV